MQNLREKLTTAILRILRPLVKILLRHEISLKEFAEQAKQAYVDVAYTDFSIESRKTTYSRAAVLTGLTRKEVMRLCHMERGALPESKRSTNRAAQVIAGWLHRISPPIWSETYRRSVSKFQRRHHGA